jgi:3-oxoadipate enol-lactonase
LVLAHTGARLGTLDRWTQRIELARTKGMAELTDLVMPMWFSPGFREREPNIVERFRRQLAASSPVGYAGCCAALRDADLRDAVAGIRARTLVIAGLQDQATPMSHAELLCERIAGAELAQIDAAHIGNVEQPESFSEAVVGFLASG